jgi:hypothetical protein
VGKPDRIRRTLARGLLAGSALAIAACARKKKAGADLAELGPVEAEKLYGKAPERGGSIAYQPAVKFVGDGAKSIRAFNADGMSWMLDAGARGVEKLRKGDLMLVTGRCAGRVLALRREGDLVRVIVGPAELTDFVRECRIEISQPVDLGQSSRLVAPNLAGIDMEIDAAMPYHQQTPEEALGSVEDLRALRSAQEEESSVRRAFFDPDAAARLGFGMRRTASGADRPIVASNVRSDGVELAVKIRNDFMQMKFVAGIRLNAPRLDYLLVVDPPGIVRDAYLGLSGAAGLRIGFIAAAGPESEVKQNVSQPGSLVPVDYLLNGIGNLGIFGAALQQRFLIKSALSARSTVLHAIGDYNIAGSLGFRFQNGSFSTSGPAITTSNNSMLHSVGGYSVGANGMVITHQLRILVGLGACGFRFGPFVALSTAAGVTRGSDLATVPGLTGMRAPACERVDLFMDAKPGLGWQLPGFFTDLVNMFVEPLGAHVEGSGGWEGPRARLFAARVWAPDNPMCRTDDYDSDTTAPNSGSAGGGGPPLPDPAPKPPDLPKEITPNDGQPGSQDGDSRGDPGHIDPRIVCPDPSARKRLRQLGIDIATICRDSGQII